MKSREGGVKGVKGALHKLFIEYTKYGAALSSVTPFQSNLSSMTMGARSFTTMYFNIDKRNMLNIINDIFT